MAGQTKQTPEQIINEIEALINKLQDTDIHCVFAYEKDKDPDGNTSVQLCTGDKSFLAQLLPCLIKGFIQIPRDLEAKSHAVLATANQLQYCLCMIPLWFDDKEQVIQ